MKGEMNTQTPQEPQFRMQHLIDFLSLYNHLNGELPKEIVVSMQFHDWYRKELEETAKRLGIAHTNIKDLTFDGIKLIVKK